jgi:high-affinity nickel-transport protein
MTNAYKWAFSTPLRKVYYNLTVTTLSVLAALMIGMIELAQVFSEKLKLSGEGWHWIHNLDIGLLGYLLVFLFLIAWGISFAIWKIFKFEDRWKQSMKT